jgi:hypothetical protein
MTRILSSALLALKFFFLPLIGLLLLLILLIKFKVHIQPFSYDRPILKSAIDEPITYFIIPGPLTPVQPLYSQKI